MKKILRFILGGAGTVLFVVVALLMLTIPIYIATLVFGEELGGMIGMLVIAFVFGGLYFMAN